MCESLSACAYFEVQCSTSVLSADEKNGAINCQNLAILIAATFLTKCTV